MYPNTSLQPGQTGAAVSQLQQFLLSQGYLTAQQIATGPGVYGPQTTAAVKKWQQANGVDNSSGPGYWGPKSIAKASGTTSNQKKDNQPYSDQEYNDAVNSHPNNPGTNSAEEIDYAVTTGDYSQLRNSYGQPFSVKEQQDALKQAKKLDEDFYRQQKEKETADAERSLAQKQADYQNYLLTSGERFQEDKTGLDQKAADQGVLFSGGRVQKQNSLQNKYAQEQAYRQETMGRDIASTASDYQYKYGNDAANSLSNYYKLGGNTYNPNVATGGVGSSGLSSVYKPSQYNYAGTRIGEQMATANQRAARLLANKGNKLLATGYNNQF